MKLAPHPLLAPLSSLYGWGSRTHRSLYEKGTLKSYRSSIPVVCVGNIVSGGSGKSPVVQHLAKLLLSKGYRPVVLSRGYGGTECGPYVVSPDTFAEKVGDEALMHCRMLDTKIPVVISRKRAAGARFIEQQKLGNIVLLDDGLQHYALDRVANILLLDVTDDVAVSRWHGGSLLPAGCMRETLAEALPRCLCVFFVQKVCSPSTPTRLPPAAGSEINKPQFHFSLFPDSFRVLGTSQKRPLEELRGKPVTAVTTPGKDSPTRSFMNSHFNQLVTSRVASSARRSLIEHCSPSCSRIASSYG